MPAEENSTAGVDLDFVQSHLLPEVLKVKFIDSKWDELTTVSNINYPYSTIRIVEFLDEKNSVVKLFLKRITIPNRTTPNIKKSIHNETTLLQQMSNEMAGQAVEIIESFPDQQVIVTKQCPGAAIDSAINAYGFWWKSNPHHNAYRDDIATRCGRWLKQYHTLTGRNGEDLTPWYNYLSGEMTWRHRALKEQLPEYAKLFDKVSDYFSNKLQHIENQGYSCIYHGDFSPHNIFYDKEKIRVIDFFDAKTGHPVIDQINFIASLASRAESPLYSKSRINKFCNSFLIAYGQSFDKNDELVSLVLLLQSVKRLLVLTNNEISRPDKKMINKAAICLHINYLQDQIKESGDTRQPGPWPFINIAMLFNNS